MPVIHRNNMRMRVRHVDPGIKQADPFDLIDLFHVAGQALGTGGHARSKLCRQIFKPEIVPLGNDQAMTWPDGVKIKQSKDMLVLEDSVRGQLVARNPAKKACFCHLALTLPVLMICEACGYWTNMGSPVGALHPRHVAKGFNQIYGEENFQ